MKQVTEQELEQLKNMRETLVEIVTKIGETHLAELMLKQQLTAAQTETKALEDRFIQFQQDERVLFSQLQEKYGSGNINMETGVIEE
jgi:septal ring factor EnvC (AmiA/AmiB activator)